MAAGTRKRDKKPPSPSTVAELRAAKYNPKKLSAAELERLKRAMTEFGDLSGIVFNRRTGSLVGGHQRRSHLPDDADIRIEKRWRRPNEVGTVAVGWIDLEGERWTYREVDVSPAREKAMNIAANRHGEGTWDFELLPDVLEEIVPEFDFEVLGFNPADGEKLLFDPDGFGAVDDGGGRLDQLTGRDVTCPKCGNEFTA